MLFVIMNFFKKITLYCFVLKLFFTSVQSSILKNALFLPAYYHRNELIWVDGFLLDFLQKKSVDLWLRKFVIYTGFIFSERLVFEFIVRVYLDFLLWPLHYNSILETSNVTEMLAINIFFYFSIFILLFFMVIVV